MTLASPGLSAEAASPDHVHLVLPRSGDVDPCHQGEVVRQVPPEGVVRLLACTFDASEAAVSTGSSAEALQWELTGPASFEWAGTETSEDGLAGATVSIDGLGTAEVTVRLCADDTCSSVVSEASVILHIVHSDPPPPECSDGVDNEGDGFGDFPEDPECSDAEDSSEGFGCPSYSGAASSCLASGVTIRYTGDRFTGAVAHARDECVIWRLVKLKKVLPGPNRTLGRDYTGSRGIWRIDAFPDPHGRFYAVAPETTVTDEDGTEVVCPRDRSVTIFIR